MRSVHLCIVTAVENSGVHKNAFKTVAQEFNFYSFSNCSQGLYSHSVWISHPDIPEQAEDAC